MQNRGEQPWQREGRQLRNPSDDVAGNEPIEVDGFNRLAVVGCLDVHTLPIGRRMSVHQLITEPVRSVVSARASAAPLKPTV